MFVKTIANYHDLEFKSDMPKGVILDVTPERATVLKEAGMVEDFKFDKQKEKASPEVKVDTIMQIPENEIAKVEETDSIPENATVVNAVEIVPSKKK